MRPDFGYNSTLAFDDGQWIFTFNHSIVFTMGPPPLEGLLDGETVDMTLLTETEYDKVTFRFDNQNRIYVCDAQDHCYRMGQTKWYEYRVRISHYGEIFINEEKVMIENGTYRMRFDHLARDIGDSNKAFKFNFVVKNVVKDEWRLIFDAGKLGFGKSLMPKLRPKPTNYGFIIGLVVGILAAIVFIVGGVIIFCYCQKKSNDKNENDKTNNDEVKDDKNAKDESKNEKNENAKENLPEKSKSKKKETKTQKSELQP
uniref:Uncharacterized protein n=1 Tax=Panagrolaimus sp. JU765 TaxID=591449 RepID=A0AC34QV64_9BILA